jgi:hypothetical protein
MRLAMTWVCLAAGWAAGAGTDAAWAGSLLAQDVKTYTGKVELKAGNQVVVTPASGVAATLPLREVARLSMVDAVAAPVNPVVRDPRLPLPWQQ